MSRRAAALSAWLLSVALACGPGEVLHLGRAVREPDAGNELPSGDGDGDGDGDGGGHADACTVDEDCTEAERPRCQPIFGRCVECLEDIECAANEICEVFEGHCEDESHEN